CVGNLVVGGAGKTPVALALAADLKRRGRRVHCLTRGYGGTLLGPVVVDRDRHDAHAVGDEALLLAAVAPTVVARDRAAGAGLAFAQGADLIVMDDGFQNPGLAKDLSLLVIDGAVGFGNGRLLPAGPLREPIDAGLARAHALVLIGQDDRGVRRQVGDRVPTLTARLAPTPAWDALRGRRVVAFAGIGRPAKFFEALNAHGLLLVERAAFADHHSYTEEELARLARAASTADAVLVTTAKDAVRLSPEARARLTVLEVAVAWDDPDALERLVAPVLAPRAGA
ncbi:MAG: tetraacyldisaccharide 4'-kinase, partial [Proteobacteria bacterium]|nr:tetraacyldisaccharide 4'-kinase [Pseudomonadota bacterium]